MLKDDANSRVVLLDRDGVINRAVRDGYVTSTAMLALIPGAAQAIAQLNEHGYRVIVVSNQQCVGKGIITAGELECITGALCDLVSQESGGVITDFFYCPHLASDGCDCRKPKPGLLLQAQARYGFDLSRTYFVGDSYTDLETARRAGCRAALVLSGLDAGRYHAGEPLPFEPDLVAADLGEAVALILERED